MADAPEPGARFAELIGRIMSNCGVLEFCTNNTIRALSKDPEWYGKVVKREWFRRIDEMAPLLSRKEILTPEHEALIQELRTIARDRNRVAHSPIASDDPTWTDPYVMVFR